MNEYLHIWWNRREMAKNFSSLSVLIPLVVFQFAFLQKEKCIMSVNVFTRSKCQNHLCHLIVV